MIIEVEEDVDSIIVSNMLDEYAKQIPKVFPKVLLLRHIIDHFIYLEWILQPLTISPYQLLGP